MADLQYESNQETLDGGLWHKKGVAIGGLRRRSLCDRPESRPAMKAGCLRRLRSLAARCRCMRLSNVKASLA
jgi:hypothetical protein